MPSTGGIAGFRAAGVDVDVRMRAQREVAARGEVRAGERDAGVGVRQEALAAYADAADTALLGGNREVAGDARGAARADRGIALDREYEADRPRRALVGE